MVRCWFRLHLSSKQLILLRFCAGFKLKFARANCRSGKVATIALLLENEATDVNCIDDNGQSPLHDAAKNGHYPAVKVCFFLVRANVELTCDLFSRQVAARSRRKRRHCRQILLHRFDASQ